MGFLTTQPTYFSSGQPTETADVITVSSSSSQPQKSNARSAFSAELRSDSVVTAKNRHAQLIPHFKEFLASIIREVPEVDSVLMQEDGNTLTIYVVVENFDFDVNEKIYDKEECIIDVFTDVNFDFHITSQKQLSDPGLYEINP
jgi:hypothetical protein